MACRLERLAQGVVWGAVYKVYSQGFVGVKRLSVQGSGCLVKINFPVFKLRGLRVDGSELGYVVNLALVGFKTHGYP